MEQVKLTNEADYLLCSLYNGFLEKRKAGVFREKAVIFGNAENIQENFAQSWPVNDIEDAIRELSRADMVECFWADNTFMTCKLTADGIIYMEARFGQKMETVLSRLASLKALLPF